MKRREFIKSAAVVATASGLGLASEARNASAAGPSSIQTYRPLGKTGLKISDISFGGGKLASSSLVARAMDMGINYIDTAPDYGRSENVLGEHIKKNGRRDKLIIATKFCDYGFYGQHLPGDQPESKYIQMVEGSLERLNTDYIDVIFVHAMGEGSHGQEDRLFSENMLGAFAKLKKAGKARFLAVSSHGPNRMEELLMKAVKSGHFDIIQPAHNFMQFPKVPDVIAEAGKRGVGVVAMKTLAGAKATNIPTGGEPFEHAAFSWVLQNPNVAGLIVTIANVRTLKYYVEASGKPFTQKSQASLDQYMLAHSAEYCRTGCGECLDACPEGVDVASILRHQMYFADYGQEKRAMAAYAGMQKKADVCGDCEGAACQQACPYGVQAKRLMNLAHQDLSFPA
ncbi:MAG: aldo/keto reductase [Nitrospinota bacterium]|nr:aldo/keto reductase [Nitrospinota bacterium]